MIDKLITQGGRDDTPLDKRGSDLHAPEGHVQLGKAVRAYTSFGWREYGETVCAELLVAVCSTETGPCRTVHVEGEVEVFIGRESRGSGSIF